MPRFRVKQTSKPQLTNYSGLALIGQCCESAQLEVVTNPWAPVSQGIRTSDIVKCTVDLLCLGNSDFEAIEPFRHDWFSKTPWVFRRFPAVCGCANTWSPKRGAIRELSVRFIKPTDALITAHKGHTCADLDNFVMDNSDTNMEAVSRTYQGVDGYTPIALYLGNEGWSIGLELRAGSHNSALQTEYFVELVFPLLQRLCAKDAKVLWCDDSAFDSTRLLLAKSVGLSLKQTLADDGKGLRQRAGGYAHAKQLKRLRRTLMRRRTVLGIVMEEVRGKMSNLNPQRAEATRLESVLERGQRLCTQRPNDKNKLYAMHAPEVESIGKGKAKQHYEFGVKTSIAVTHRSGLVVGARTVPGNPYDGHTLAAQLEQTTILLEDTGKQPKQVFVDLGYRGVDADNPGIEIIHSGRAKSLTQ